MFLIFVSNSAMSRFLQSKFPNIFAIFFIKSFLYLRSQLNAPCFMTGVFRNAFNNLAEIFLCVLKLTSLGTKIPFCFTNVPFKFANKIG